MRIFCFVITIVSSSIVILSMKKLNNEKHEFEVQILSYDVHIYFFPSALNIIPVGEKSV